MTREECQDLVDHLDSLTRGAGYTLVGWNSCGFGLSVLAEESGMADRCARLALSHVDMMFDFFCRRGHALSLNKACKGAGLAGKPGGMTGADAPRLWAADEYEQVLAYLKNDVQQTLALAQAVEQSHEVKWTSQSGRPCSCPVPQWLTVQEALALPLPDVSSMRDPWPRAKFVSWMAGHLPVVPAIEMQP